MIISIDQRLVTAASLGWETFSDQDAQDHYWNTTLSASARIREAATTVATLIHFLLSLQAWLRGLDQEDIEQYQLALPEGSIPKLMGAAPVAPEEMNPWDELVEVDQAAAVSVDEVSAICVSPQLLLPPAKQTSKGHSNRKPQGSKSQSRSRTKTKTKKNAIPLEQGK